MGPRDDLRISIILIGPMVCKSIQCRTCHLFYKDDKFSKPLIGEAHLLTTHYSLLTTHYLALPASQQPADHNDLGYVIARMVGYL